MTRCVPSADRPSLERILPCLPVPGTDEDGKDAQPPEAGPVKLNVNSENRLLIFSFIEESKMSQKFDIHTKCVRKSLRAHGLL